MGKKNERVVSIGTSNQKGKEEEREDKKKFRLSKKSGLTYIGKQFGIPLGRSLGLSCFFSLFLHSVVTSLLPHLVSFHLSFFPYLIISCLWKTFFLFHLCAKRTKCGLADDQGLSDVWREWSVDKKLVVAVLFFCLLGHFCWGTYFCTTAVSIVRIRSLLPKCFYLLQSITLLKCESSTSFHLSLFFCQGSDTLSFVIIEKSFLKNIAALKWNIYTNICISRREKELLQL